MVLQTPVTAQMLQEAFEFGTKYYQNPAKVTRGRTSSQNRSLGALIDANIVGKIVELGVNQILTQLDGNKKFFPDMEIRDVFEFGQPDIIEVKEGENEKRPPNCFVEIKNSPKNFLWVGLYTTQFDDMKNYVKNNEENIYVVYASLRTKDGAVFNVPSDAEESEKTKIIERKKDLFGIFLKSKGSLGSLFDFFANPSDFLIQIDYVIIGKELSQNGQVFRENEPWASPEIFVESGDPVATDGTVKERFTELDLGTSRTVELPTDSINNSIAYPTQFGSLKCTGDFRVFEEIKNSRRGTGNARQVHELKTLFIKCASSVVAKSNFLGEYNLDAGKTYRIKIQALVQSKDRNDISYPKRNIDAIVGQTVDERMNEIATKL